MEQNCKYTPIDFKSDQEVKWCPGCGDHAILSAVQKALPEVAAELNYKHERFTFVSGIGCSSRFPYYMHTFGFHGIHGRAAAIATGVKVSNPKLSVWQVSGDGDALAIGGNHFIHAVRRNIDINILLFNNEIYGLTKGQYSPTSKLGKITKTSPFGTIEHPFLPGELVLGARGTFYARSLDVDVKLTMECLKASAKHDGTSVFEIMQNCVIFNDKTHDSFTNKEFREDRTIVLKHGEPMIFGKNKDKGLVLQGLGLKVVTIGEGGWKLQNILVHNAYQQSPGVHMMLVNMKGPDFPIALGVIRDVKDFTYDDCMQEQIAEVKEKSNIKCCDDLLRSGDTWEL
ncbi:MAG: 2-oxoacid:ferredoxin oxidoreductase subunit beta [Rikenellaceae bacterium]